MRFEYKFLIPTDLLPELRRLMAPCLSSDPYAARTDSGGYSVRSIYFDTPGLQLYHEKDSGLKQRRKFRLRGYGDFSESARVFLEIKRKDENAVSKSRAPVAYRDIESVFRTGDIDRFISDSDEFPRAREDGRGFFFHYFGRALRPAALIVYDREAYTGRFDRTLRITVDRNLRSAFLPTLNRLFSEEGLLPSRRETNILEVKFHGRFPAWMAQILRSLGIRRQSFSKYCVCLDDQLAANRLTIRDVHILPTHVYCGRGRLS